MCNACESLVVHEKVEKDLLQLLGERLAKYPVELRGDEKARTCLDSVKPASEEDWGKEYLDYILSVKTVSGIDEAIAHINRYNTGHSEAIITENYTNAQKFLDEIDAAAVYVNASTRFTDGFEFGFGAEIGISTQKLHARGPHGTDGADDYKIYYLRKRAGAPVRLREVICLHLPIMKECLPPIKMGDEPPAEEPVRQQWYMKKAGELVKEKSLSLGRPLRAMVKTFGCQMNERDSEKLRGILDAAGYELTEEEEADFVIYNTCTVRENANLKVYGRLGYLGGLKKKNPDMVIALCGCMMQEPEVVEKIRRSYSFVDLIFGTHNIYKFAELLVTALENDRMILDIWKDTDKIVEELPASRTYAFKSGVNIMFGCNNFCSYCIVPYVRGRERSRRPEDIIREIEGLVKDGVVEVMLLGQNVNSYGKNLPEPVTFARLLKQVRRFRDLKESVL